MKLELGAGYRPTPGFIHQDARPGRDIELIGDAAEICSHPEIGEKSCDEIRATHLLEHFSYRRTHDVLREWFRALKPGGTLYIEVPNFSWQTNAHASGWISDEEAVQYVFGEQDYEGNYHYAAFTADRLDRVLADAGFKAIMVMDVGQVLVANALRGDEDGNVLPRVQSAYEGD